MLIQNRVMLLKDQVYCLRALLDPEVSMEIQVVAIARRDFSSAGSLTATLCEKGGCSICILLTSRLGYWNSVCAGLP